MNEVILARCVNCGYFYKKMKFTYGRGRAIKVSGVRAGNTVTCSKKCSREWGRRRSLVTTKKFTE